MEEANAQAEVQKNNDETKVQVNCRPGNLITAKGAEVTSARPWDAGTNC